MEAHLRATLTVDDWGYIDVTPLSGSGPTVRIINLTDEVESPGPRNGHVRWSGQTDEAIVLQPGQYSIIVRQDNAPYSQEYAHATGYNVSFCQVEATIEYVAIPAPEKSISLLTASEYGEVKSDDTDCIAYIKSGDVVSSKGLHAISVGLEYAGPAGDAGFDNSPSSTVESDRFKPDNIKPDSSGKARFKVWTLGNTGTPSVVSLNGATSEPISYLPAVFEDLFEVTVYYTCMESNFTGNVEKLTCYVGNSNDETVVLDEVKSEFKTQVRMEGFGQLQTPVEHNGKSYQYLAKFDSRWRIYDRVLGNAGNTLIPKLSCATDDKVI